MNSRHDHRFSEQAAAPKFEQSSFVNLRHLAEEGENPDTIAAVVDQYHAILSNTDLSGLSEGEIYNRNTILEWTTDLSPGEAWTAVPIYRGEEIVGGYHYTRKEFESGPVMIVELSFARLDLDDEIRSEVLSEIEGSIEETAKNHQCNMIIRELSMDRTETLLEGTLVAKFPYIQPAIDRPNPSEHSSDDRLRICTENRVNRMLVAVRRLDGETSFPVGELFDGFIGDPFWVGMYPEDMTSDPAVKEMREFLALNGWERDVPLVGLEEFKREYDCMARCVESLEHPLRNGSVLNVEAVNLRDLYVINPDAARMLLESYYKEFAKTFPDPNDREEIDNYEGYLLDTKTDSFQITIYLNAGEILGGTHWRALSADLGFKIGIEEFIWVAKSQRGQGFGSTFDDHLIERLEKEGCIGVLDELEDVNAMSQREYEELFDPEFPFEDRLRFWDSRGRKQFDAAYLVPPFEGIPKEVTYYMLAVRFFEPNSDQMAIPKEHYFSMIRAYIRSFPRDDVETDRTYLKIVKSLEEVEEVNLISLFDRRSYFGASNSRQ